MTDLVAIEPIAVQMVFDYDSLDNDIRPQVQALIQRGHFHLHRTNEEMLAFGDVLLEIKTLLPHGQFRSLIDAEYGLPDSTITYIMHKAKCRKSEIENANIGILPKIDIEQPVEPVEEVEECVMLRTPREVVEEWFTKYPTLTHLSNREIAKRCGVTEGTVRNYKKEVFPEPIVAPIPGVVEEEAPLPVVEGTIEPPEDVKAAREAKRQQQQERNEQLKTKGVDLPPDTYACLVVDPPWPMQKIERDLYPNQVGFEYPTMDEEELKDFQLPALAADSCHLYLWTTQKHLPFAIRLAEHWGFKYQCLMTWVKNVGFTPYSWMYSTEHVLFCTKGNLPLLRQGMRLDFSAKRREHSRKPDEFYDLVREASPEPRLDVFSREQRDGFKQYGNEATKYV